MAVPDNITETIAATAAGPASAGNRTENATAHNPRDLIEVDKYLRSRAAADATEAAANPFGQVQFVQIELPGACR